MHHQSQFPRTDLATKGRKYEAAYLLLYESLDYLRRFLKRKFLDFTRTVNHAHTQQPCKTALLSFKLAHFSTLHFNIHYGSFNRV